MWSHIKKIKVFKRGRYLNTEALSSIDLCSISSKGMSWRLPIASIVKWPSNFIQVPRGVIRIIQKLLDSLICHNSTSSWHSKTRVGERRLISKSMLSARRTPNSHIFPVISQLPNGFSHLLSVVLNNFSGCIIAILQTVGRTWRWTVCIYYIFDWKWVIGRFN